MQHCFPFPNKLWRLTTDENEKVGSLIEHVPAIEFIEAVGLSFFNNTKKNYDF